MMQTVSIAMTHAELEHILAGLEEGMAVVNALEGLGGMAIDEEMRMFHLRVKWAHALVCPAAPPAAEVFEAMPTTIMERLTLNA